MVNAGTTLGGNIRLEEELGRGAMGVVWRATHLALGSEVAVKILQRAPGRESAAEIRFAREARGAAMLDTPHVVKVMDLGATAEGAPYIVMELLRGRDLRSHIEGRGHLSPAETSHIVEQLCRALAVAHRHQIVHRDIKPANVFLLDPDGQPFVKVLDFGVAKYAAQDMSLTHTGALMGTPYYMSPEQFIDPRHIDHRSDLWSVAVVTYGCLLGELPFRGETVGALSLAVHAGEFHKPSHLRPGLPPAVDAFFERAFQRQPEQRFQSAADLAAAWQAAVQGAHPASPVVAHTPSHAPAHGLSSLPPATSGAVTSGERLPQSTQAPTSGPPVNVVPFAAPPSATPSAPPTTGPAAHSPTPATFAQDAPVGMPPPKRGRGWLVAGGAIAALGLIAVTATVVFPMLERDRVAAATEEKRDDDGDERDAPTAKTELEPKEAIDDGADFPDLNPTEPQVPDPRPVSPAPDAPPAPDPPSAPVPDGPAPTAPPSASPGATPGRKTIPDVTGIAQHLYGCWARYDGPEAKKAVSMTLTLIMPDRGTTPQGIRIAGAEPYAAFRGCVMPKLSGHARLKYTDRERGNNVVAAVTLPKCRWDKAQRKHICK